MIGTDLSHADINANIIPRSSLGTSFDEIDLSAGRMIGLKIDQ